MSVLGTFFSKAWFTRLLVHFAYVVIWKQWVWPCYWIGLLLSKHGMTEPCGLPYTCAPFYWSRCHYCIATFHHNKIRHSKVTTKQTKESEVDWCSTPMPEGKNQNYSVGILYAYKCLRSDKQLKHTWNTNKGAFLSAKWFVNLVQRLLSIRQFTNVHDVSNCNVSSKTYQTAQHSDEPE